MIYFEYDRENATVMFWAYGDGFHDAVSLFKAYRLTYNPDNKQWACSPSKALEVFSAIEEGMIPAEEKPQERELIEKDKFSFGKRELKKKRRKLYNNLMPLPPIEGKSPNERFQVDCVKRGISQNRLALFLGMGTGKTAISTYILNHLFADGSIDRVMIVAPPEGVVNWKRELLRFSTFIDGEDDILISSANNNRDFLEEGGGKKVIILTYRHFLTVSDDYYKRKNKGKVSKKYLKPTIPLDTWGDERAIILDESHSIRNNKARTSKVLHLHKNYFEYRYMLTGTPAPNEFAEMYSQIKFLDPGMLPKQFQDWVEMIAVVGTKFSDYAIHHYLDREIEKWEDTFRSVAVRLKTEDVLDLPERYMKPTYVEMPPKQKDIYRSMVEREVNVLKERDGRIIPQKLINRFPYISQALDNPELLKGKIDDSTPKLAKDIDGFKFDRDHGKVPIVKSLVENHISRGEKVVLFDYHPTTLEMLHEMFSSYNPITIHGQGVLGIEESGSFNSDSERRDYAIEKFKTSSANNLLIASSLVVTTAINLQKASVAIYFSRDYSYLNWSQSLGRLHRIGQDKNVVVYPLIFEGSLDVSLHQALERKEDLDKSIFNKELKNREALTLDEWKSILNGYES